LYRQGPATREGINFYRDERDPTFAPCMACTDAESSQNVTGGPQEWTARLACGALLTFETRSFVPGIGDHVRCRSHGYCVVEDVAVKRQDARPRSRAKRRTQRELVEHLRRSPGQSLSPWQRQRFTLRIVYEAARSGDVIHEDRSRNILIHATGQQPNRDIS
jgi:hypothetical protein